MFGRTRKSKPSRSELIDQKHRIAGEIVSIRAEIRRRRSRGDAALELEAQLTRLQSEHYQTRLAIDRTEP